jgi:hypothetical protein
MKEDHLPSSDCKAEDIINLSLQNFYYIALPNTGGTEVHYAEAG